YDESLGLFPVGRIKNDDEKGKRQNIDEYFGQQLYGILNANIICNYYHRDSISIDKPIDGYLTITNNSLSEQIINAQIQVDLTSYTGLVIAHIYLIEKSLIIQPKQSMLII
ncbi:unnamed protein product, partial [Onchocerca flexuosa]|uniref:Wzt_C domain-containing protein n=1 Tax=Onchocerca flexuosa TaxID=387005 RepID=A0A183I725_9BILA